jgi:hypothetical protein
MTILTGILLKMMVEEFKHDAPEWKSIQPYMIPQDLAFLKNESNTQSDFDQTNKRNSLLQSPSSTIIIKRCEYGQVVAIGKPDILEGIPWELWGRILRKYTPPNKPNKPNKHKRFKVFFLADESLREFPSHTTIKITPENINGGYTYHCNRETIVIYRAEDATRVLLHELMHACCMDNMKLGLDRVEGETEAWAELLYIVFLSRGRVNIFKRLLKNQCDWIQEQNRIVKTYQSYHTEFPYRYTICKEEVWKRWGIIRNNIPQNNIGNNSLRLTHPPDNTIKRLFGVPNNSHIL